MRLLLPADSPAVPALWTDTYKLDVRFAGELPDLPSGVVQLEGELDIASKLKSLQEYCVVGESKFPGCLRNQNRAGPIYFRGER